jgi:hypothetical protein
MTNLLDCGHVAVPDGIGTGYATDPDTNTTLCYSCADKRERAAMANATAFICYVSTDARTLTTWSGGSLATIDHTDTNQPGNRRCTPTGGYWSRYAWHATDPAGNRWYGVNGGPGMFIRIRRIKGATAMSDTDVRLYTAVKIVTENDTNGNPRRGWLIHALPAGGLVGFAADNYRGHVALSTAAAILAGNQHAAQAGRVNGAIESTGPKGTVRIIELCELDVRPMEYRLACQMGTKKDAFYDPKLTAEEQTHRQF